MSADSESLSLIFLFFAIFVGAFLTFAISRYMQSIPYTVLLFFVGIAFSYIANATNAHRIGNELTYSIVQWENIDPNLFLYALLPVLLFGDAMSLNIYMLKKVLCPAILLAGLY